MPYRLSDAAAPALPGSTTPRTRTSPPWRPGRCWTLPAFLVGLLGYLRPVRHLAALRAVSGAIHIKGAVKHALPAGLLGIVLTMSGCWATSTQPSAFRATGQDIAGSWCGAEAERFTFRPDAGFTVSGIGSTYRDDLIGDSRYADGYRVQTEFGGVPPTSGAGTWELADGGDRLYLTYDNLDRKPFTEGSSLDPEQHDGRLRLVLYLGDRDSGDTRSFERCVSA